MRLRDIADRVAIAKALYWNLDKSYRIKVGLRAEAFEHSYSGTLILQYSEMLLTEARLERYPIQMGEFGLLTGFDLPGIYRNLDEVAVALDPMIADLENRLAQAHTALK